MKFILVLLLQLLFCISYCQSWQWGVRGGGSSNGQNNSVETVEDLTTDNVGNVYILSTIESSGFPTITGVPNVINRYGARDILLVSYNCNGQFRWKKVIGGSSDDNGRAIGV